MRASGGVATERQRTGKDVRPYLYPEIHAGRFSHVDGTVEFYQRVQALLDRDLMVLDFGAGRGQFLEDPISFRRDLHDLRGKARRIIGVDVDEAVLQNPTLDDAYVVQQGEPIGLEDASVDVVLSDWTFEHVSDPHWAARELDRILRRGGWICARTPNKWGYIGLGAQVVPNRLHAAMLRRLQPAKAVRDTFPTAYRMNTKQALRKLFPPARYDHCIYTMNNEPAYFGSSRAAQQLTKATFRVLPSSLAAVLYVFLQKRSSL